MWAVGFLGMLLESQMGCCEVVDCHQQYLHKNPKRPKQFKLMISGYLGNMNGFKPLKRSLFKGTLDGFLPC